MVALRTVVLKHKPDLKIEEMYAIVAVGPEGEGVMGGSMVIEGQPMMVPFVGADIARIKQLLPFAKQVATASKTSFKIYKFSNKTDITNEFI
jgi:hypothetical protein